MRKFAIVVSIIVVAYQWHADSSNDLVMVDGDPHYELIMYSSTTCGFCVRSARELREQKIAFREYLIDKDHGKFEELITKLERAGFQPGVIGTPVFEANGTLLPGDPKMSLIKSTLGLGR